MKIISIWQPWASLVIHGHKFIETRGWCAPRSVIGTTIGIAATKMITPDQRAAYNDPEFQRHYQATGLAPLEELPRGCILGTAHLHSCELMDEEFTDDLTDEEVAFGWYAPGRWAWRMRYPRAFQYPVVARGQQGIWEHEIGGNNIIYWEEA